MRESTNRKVSIFLALMGIVIFSVTSALAEKRNDFRENKRRVSPGCYDPGPQKESSWAKLFAEIPNYRAIGLEVLGYERFRWQVGPMTHRGRTGQNEVKALIVGQEGAQDENVSNRAFTGSTGTRTQKLLNHLGLRSSYLFLNTFVYTINCDPDCQRSSNDPAYMWMEQNLDSPIVKYRHRLFDNAARENPQSLSLLIGVGAGGTLSLKTWIEDNGGECRMLRGQVKDSDGKNAYRLQCRNLSELRKKFRLRNDILVTSVPHPGGAKAGQGPKIVAGFKQAILDIYNFKSENSSWLQPDENISHSKLMSRLSGSYKYGYAPIPHCDFAFGTNRVMGDWATASNRGYSSNIQVYSKSGTYDKGFGKKVKDHYNLPKDFKMFDVDESKFVTYIPGMRSNELPYEAPKSDSYYDYGPCGTDDRGVPVQKCKMSEALQNWDDALNAVNTKPVSDGSFGTGPVYRGNLSGAKVLVLADQQDHADFFSARALTGTGGQRLQAVLEASGLKPGEYVIIRTLPVDTLGMSEHDVKEIALDRRVMSVRDYIFKGIMAQGDLKLVVAMGSVAQAVLEKSVLNEHELRQVHLPSPDLNRGFKREDFRSAVKEIAGIMNRDYTKMPESALLPIPRSDLPFGTRWWMGAYGDRAVRSHYPESGVGHYYLLQAPRATGKLAPMELDSDTKSAIYHGMKAAGLH